LIGISVAGVRAAAFGSCHCVLAWPSPAFAEVHYSVRNDTPRAFTCGLMREDRSVIDRFVIASGEEWRQTTPGGGTRELLCDAATITPRWRMQPGVRYRLTEDPRTGRIVLLRVRGEH
jgi:hypothetical protein